MAGSGIKISDDVRGIFQRINQNYKPKGDDDTPLRYAVFEFNKKCDEITLVEAVEPAKAMEYSDLIATLPADDVRYLAYDLEFVNPQGTNRRKVILISWIPDHATVKRKMVAASTFNTLKSAVGVRKDYIEAGDIDAILEPTVAEKLGGTVVPK